jgi:DNA-binding transcriptional MerR regulator
MNIITSTELARTTGATKRQIENWCRSGILVPIEKPKRGMPRKFDKSIVPKVEFLAQMSQIMRGITLKTLYDNFDYGFLEFEDDIYLSWR